MNILQIPLASIISVLIAFTSLGEASVRENNRANSMGFASWKFIEKSSSVELTQSKVQEALEAKVTELVKSVYEGDRYQFDVIAKRIPSQLDQKGVVIQQVKQVDTGLPKGYTVFDVMYQINNQTRQTKVQFNIQVMEMLPVPLDRITAGEMLRETMFTYQWVDITNLRGEIIKQASDVNGKVANGLLRNGYPIRPSDLSAPPIVEAGNSLTLYYEQNGILLALPVISRVSASKGEVINVWCETTRKTYRARVASSSTVQWEQTL
ncbi:flagellar basal body P-ring formation protein FlgA [bacterium]|nr:MAG: flagellar basal body P-ring formation protein FlgA [bacterium]